MILFQKVCKGYTFCWDFPSVSVGKESAWMQETWVQSVGLENILEKETETHSSILPGKSQG